MADRQQPVVYETRIRVRYAETDAMGIVHHANYLVYFEEGRSSFTRQAGMPYTRLEQDGFLLAVTEIEARYHAAAVYDNELVIRTHIDQLRSRGITFAYEVVDAETDQRLATGKSHHVCLDRERKPARIPAYWYDIMKSLATSAR